jgi:hypothetical protein
VECDSLPIDKVGEEIMGVCGTGGSPLGWIGVVDTNIGLESMESVVKTHKTSAVPSLEEARIHIVLGKVVPVSAIDR